MKLLYVVMTTNEADQNRVCELIQENQPSLGFPGCWSINPNELSEEVKENVLGQIAHTIECLIRSSEYENVVFGWETCGESLLDELLSKIDPADYNRKIIDVDRLKQLIENHCYRH